MKSPLIAFFQRACLALFLCALTPRPMPAAGIDPYAVSPVGEAKPFHGTLRAKDFRLGTLTLGSDTRISRVLALDAHSRLIKGIRPATLVQFEVGDVIDGLAFPDQHGRMVVAVATARARPLTAAESKSAKPAKARKTRSSGGAGAKMVGAPIPPSSAGAPAVPPLVSRGQKTPKVTSAAPAQHRGHRSKAIPIARSPKK